MPGESTAPSISVYMLCIPVLDLCASPRIGRTARWSCRIEKPSAGTSGALGATVSIKTLTLQVAQHLPDTSARTQAVPTLPRICFLSTLTCWLPCLAREAVLWHSQCYLTDTIGTDKLHRVSLMQWCACFRTYLLSCHINKPDLA